MKNRKARALMARTMETINLVKQHWTWSLDQSMFAVNNTGRSNITTVKIVEQCPWTGNSIARYRTVM